MSVKTYSKDPSAFLDYSMDWSDWLATGEIITVSTWATSSVDLTLSLDAATDTITTIWASGGVAGKDYTITNTITTDATRVDQRSITLTCEDR